VPIPLPARVLTAVEVTMGYRTSRPGARRSE
jgi:hypothetical protein